MTSNRSFVKNTCVVCDDVCDVCDMNLKICDVNHKIVTYFYSLVNTCVVLEVSGWCAYRIIGCDECYVLTQFRLLR